MPAERNDMTGPLVVGVRPDQHGEVIQAAAALARKLEVALVCAYVDEASYLVEWDPHRATHRLSLHPDKDDDDVRTLQDQLRSILGQALEGQGVEWSLRTLAGDPSRALGRLAADCDASMIVVGTPEHGLGHRLSEMLNGSISAWLSHHQSCPVLVVPDPS
ncbi:universal stress protein [Pseudarthrobacter sp. J75]|uniref:universal stress protein n=1 Tax=unclassified Pseudarthrobacter TaxID=2647000 RepID=UPI002E81413D|nr:MULTISPECIES: universal stress protein [unclassified Pseudarthrobacter]MEE2523619.1 universal stress protein [Pseudarthrobacter sp. J47]MEE2530009.1 universal stress protein [Pseudarthrobacter sp. J75]MEE2570581.1 universal stress protein [Pseudarthrobacter sp. J64]